MTVWIALLRGINVGGKNVVKMNELSACLTQMGLGAVKTYIQSGNIVFEAQGTATDLSDLIAQGIKDRFELTPDVMVMPDTQFRSIADAVPFDEAGLDPKTLHIWFLKTQLDAQMQDTALDHMRDKQSETETVFVTSHAVYLHAPDGIGRSKLAAGMETCLGGPATARNLRSVRKILDLAS